MLTPSHDPNKPPQAEPLRVSAAAATVLKAFGFDCTQQTALDNGGLEAALQRMLAPNSGMAPVCVGIPDVRKVTISDSSGTARNIEAPETPTIYLCGNQNGVLTIIDTNGDVRANFAIPAEQLRVEPWKDEIVIRSLGAQGTTRAEIIVQHERRGPRDIVAYLHPPSTPHH